MKYLHVIQPEVMTYCLDTVKKEMVSYLNVPVDAGIRELKADIDAGAVMLRELADPDGQKDAHLSVILADTMEEGYLAVTWLAALSNERDLGRGRHTADNPAEITKYGDPIAQGVRVHTLREWRDEADWSEWQESPYEIPLVPVADAVVEQRGIEVMPGIVMMMETEEKNPYWKKAVTESICFCHDWKVDPAVLIGKYPELLERFRSNRHVYLIFAGRKPDEVLNGKNQAERDISGFLGELLLDQQAALYCVTCSTQEERKHLELVLENLARQHKLQFSEEVSPAYIAEQILSSDGMAHIRMADRIIASIVQQRRAKGIRREQILSEDLDIFLFQGETQKRDQNRDQNQNRDQKQNQNQNKNWKMNWNQNQDGGSAWEYLEKELYGMDEIKKELRRIINVMKYRKLRQAKGLGDDDGHNILLMLGAPGTAKTTTAKLLGKVMKEEKLLDGARFISVNGAQLKGMYVGQSAPKVHQLFEEHDVILIDEAYSIVSAGSDGPDSFGQEAMAQLMIELENHGNDRLVMFAGYGGEEVRGMDNKMKEFLESNPGIQSRIQSTLWFRSYETEELCRIFDTLAEREGFHVSGACEEQLKAFFEKRRTERSFGNGREARNLLEHTVWSAAARMDRYLKERCREERNPEDELTDEQLTELTADDVEYAISRMEAEQTAQNGKTCRNIGFLQG